MNNDEATDLLNRASRVLIPDEPAPLTFLLVAAKEGQCRKTRKTLALAAASVALVLGGAAVGQQVIADNPGRPSENLTSDTPDAPAGMRFVGMGRVVVAVPASWTQTQHSCTTSPNGNVYFVPVPPRSCLAPNLSDPASMQPTLGISELRLSPSALDKFKPLEGSAGAVSEGGLCLETKPASCSERIAVPSEGVLFTLAWWRTEEGRATAAQVRESLQLLPEGYTTVPYLPRDYPTGPAGNLLIEAGLKFDESPPQTGGQTGRAGQFGTVPQAGSVVAVGSTVTMLLEAPWEGNCDSGTRVEEPSSIPRGPDYPTNASGLTYGGAAAGSYPDPDLIAVSGNCGHTGYALRWELDDPAPWSPEAGRDAGTPRTIPVYASDGVTQIDTFTIGGAENGSTSGPETANPRGPGPDAVQGEWAVTIAGIQREDGGQQFDTYRDVELTAAFTGDLLRIWDGCQVWTATFELADGDFTLTQDFVTEASGNLTPCDRQAPLGAILQNIRHVTLRGGDAYAHLDNFQIVLVLKRPEK